MAKHRLARRAEERRLLRDAWGEMLLPLVL